jgi:uncharacterized protein YkwD
MFRRTTRQSPFWAGAAFLALLAAPHTLLAQNARPTVRVDVTNWTGRTVEFALVGPDSKDLGPARSVQPGGFYHTSNRTLPGGSAKGYKWVVRDPETGRVLKDVPADRAQRSITVGKRTGSDVPKESGSGQTPGVNKLEFNKERGSAQTPRVKGRGAASGQNQTELIRLINQYRQANGKGPLSMDSTLTRAAQDHTDWMRGPTGKFSHEGKNGSSFTDRIQAAGGRPGPWAENISGYSTPQDVVNNWKNSAGHNRNMLGPYCKVGIGYRGSYWTAVFSN